MNSRFSFMIPALLIIAFIITGCTTSKHIGSYRVDRVKDGFANLICFPHTELYVTEDSTFLGACGAPRMITKDFGMPSDPSCFAVSSKGDSIVYFHNSLICGGGSKSTEKPTGIYRHSKKEGDILIYSGAQVKRTWSNNPIETGAIRATWTDNIPSKKGALCGQTIILNANGNETVKGKQSDTCY
jgi:hypothetical protein